MIVKQRNANQIVGEADSGLGVYVSWKRRPSEIKGYQRALYYSDPNGNYLRVDYNIKSGRIRLYYEDNAEGKIVYSAIIEKGSIISEKNMTSGRSTPLARVFNPLAPLFANIPNKEVIALIGDNYGLATINREIKEKEKRRKIEQTRKKYFKPDSDKGNALLGSFDENKKLGIIDVIDVMLGVVVSVILFFLFRGYQAPGIFMAFFGIGVGLMDIFVREREPIFVKILLFLVGGVATYIYGYYLY